MRRLYCSEGPIDTLLQIAEQPVRDGDLVGKKCRDDFVRLGWVARAEGWNLITQDGAAVVQVLSLKRMPGHYTSTAEQAENLRRAFAENDIPWPEAPCSAD